MLYTNTYPLFLRLMNNFRKDETLARDLHNTLEHTNGPFSENLFEQGSSVIRKFFESSRKYCYDSLVKSIETIYRNGYRKILDYEYFGQVILEEVYYQNYYYSFLVKNGGEEKVIILTNFYNETEKNYENLLLTGTPHKPFTSMNKGIWTYYGDYIVINTYNAFCAYGSSKGLDINSELNVPFFHDVVSDLQQLPQNYENAIFKYTVFKNVVIVYYFDLVNSHKKLLSQMDHFAAMEPPFD